MLDLLTEYYSQWYPEPRRARDKALFATMRGERAERGEDGNLVLLNSVGQNITDRSKPTTNEHPPQED